MKKILVLEPHPYHAEVVLGIVHYFELLNYEIDVLIREEVETENPFCRMQHKANINYYKIEEIKNILSSIEEKKYEFLFLTSMEYYDGKTAVKFLDFLGFEPKTQFGIMGIYHTVSLIERFKDYEYLQQGRIFCLSEFQMENSNLKMVNPHYFVDNINPFKGFSKLRKYIIIGVNFSEKRIAEAVNNLSRIDKKFEIIRIGGKVPQGLKKIKNIVRNLSVKILGIFIDRYRAKSKLLYYLKDKGRIDFPNMFKTMEKIDFVIVMLDFYDDTQKHYYNITTSGIFQLIYGFNKICVIQREVAKCYGLTERECIIYKGDDLTDALIRANNLTEEEYLVMCNNLKELSNKINDKSLENLKITINNIEQGEG